MPIKLTWRVKQKMSGFALCTFSSFSLHTLLLRQNFYHWASTAPFIFMSVSIRWCCDTASSLEIAFVSQRHFLSHLRVIKWLTVVVDPPNEYVTILLSSFMNCVPHNYNHLCCIPKWKNPSPFAILLCPILPDWVGKG